MMRRIIAVDFDGCIVTDNYPDIAGANFIVIAALKDLKKLEGARLILWTCRSGRLLDEAVDFCRRQGLEFDAVNENLPESIERFGCDTRKVYATEYWDDRAVRMPSSGYWT